MVIGGGVLFEALLESRLESEVWFDSWGLEGKYFFVSRSPPEVKHDFGHNPLVVLLSTRRTHNTPKTRSTSFSHSFLLPIPFMTIFADKNKANRNINSTSGRDHS